MHTMKLARSALLAVAEIAAVANAGGASDQPISSKGHWHVDFDQSSFPFASHPHSVTLEVMRDDEQVYEATETVVERDGKITSRHMKAEDDGKSYPVEGSPDHIMMSITR